MHSTSISLKPSSTSCGKTKRSIPRGGSEGAPPNTLVPCQAELPPVLRRTPEGRLLGRAPGGADSSGSSGVTGKGSESIRCHEAAIQAQSPQGIVCERRERLEVHHILHVVADE